MRKRYKITKYWVYEVLVQGEDCVVEGVEAEEEAGKGAAK